MTVAAFDIECDDWDTFVVGALLHDDGTVGVYWDEDTLFDAICECECDVWTWAGGRYDMVWLAEVAERRAVRVVARCAGGSPVSMKVGHATIKDGFKLFPESLKKCAPLAKLEKAPTGLECRRDHDDFEDCGGYCRIRKAGMPARDKRALEAYVTHDVRCTAGVVEALHKLAAELDIDIKSTVGASAWATLKKMGAPEAEWEWRDYRAARRGYYGGRTELYQARADVVWRADINSAYPAALSSTPVPVGPCRRVFGDAASAAFAAGKPGIYDARVHVPECHIPPLPTRGRDRLLFVTGRFAGSWTHIELAAAVALGVTLEKVTAGVVWDRAETIAKPFVDCYWGHRSRYGKKSPEGRWLKWFVNSATGKLAMKPEGERMMVRPREGERRCCPAAGACWYNRKPGGPLRGALCGRIGTCCKHTCTGRCGRWSQVDKKGVIWTAPEYRLSDCSHVQWAATLTAVTRVEWLHQAMSVGVDLAYGDTDSIYATCPIERNIGDELGQWNDEGVGLDWAARGPKAYRYADGATGEYVTRSKGVPRLGRLDGPDGARDLKWNRWAAGESVALPGGVWGLKGGARRGDVFSKRKGADGGPYQRAARSDPHYAGSRVVADDGTTRPLAWDEYHRLVESGAL